MRREESVNGLTKIEYRVGFRVYPEKITQSVDDFKRFWPGRSILTDSKGLKYFGDNDNLDEWVSSYSKRIAPFGTNCFSDKTDSFESENYFIDDRVPVSIALIITISLKTKKQEKRPM